MGSKISYKWLSAVGPSPCDDCEHGESCGDLDLACKDYAAYSYHGVLVREDRTPTRKQFESIYGCECE